MKRYEPGPLFESFSESPMPIKSGAMQRPKCSRWGITLRHRYDEVGFRATGRSDRPVPPRHTPFRGRALASVASCTEKLQRSCACLLRVWMMLALSAAFAILMLG